MCAKSLVENNIKVENTWEEFIKNGSFEREKVRPLIADSWIRSKEGGVDPYSNDVPDELSPIELEERIVKILPLLNAAKPFMKTLYKTVGESGLIVRLTDSDGYVLECFGDESVFLSHKNLHLFKGTNVREDVVGTNAIGIALKKNRALQVLGAEHYREAYHQWTSSAAAIRGADGTVLGVLSMSGDYELVHPHTLGMVLAAAQAIEHEIELERINKELQRKNEHSFAIMESISEGIICVDEKGIIEDINRFARKLLGLKRKKIEGMSVFEILPPSKRRRMLDVIQKGEKYDEEEIAFLNSSNRKISCILNVTPIWLDGVKTGEAVFTFREAKRIHNLVNKIVGAKATFTFEDILGDSEQIKEAIRMAGLVADTDATILLHGESGTGKELFAQAIHNASKRRNQSFVFLNCGAIPRDLVASELFGYIEGAFTGAKRGGHPGKFELADGGTIFLDEIGDMPLDAQANLLRVLETKEIMRVGGHDVIPVDIRVIAATHKDLQAEVERGNFRQDLYFRLKVLPIHTPSLRERRTDIRNFIDYFMASFLRKEGKSIKGVDESFYIAMERYNWPGNVRELQNVMQLVTNMAKQGTFITNKNLPPYMIHSESEGVEFKEDKVLPLAVVERNLIIAAIRKTKGNLVQTAKLLEIGRSTLYRRIEKYGIDPNNL